MLSEIVKKLVDCCFAPDERADVEALLDADLPTAENDLLLIERIQVAAIKKSKGDVELLRRWMNSAREDWRDILTSAGFDWDAKAHLSWRPWEK